MEILSILNITENQLQAINPKAHQTYEYLMRVKHSIDSGLSDENLVKVYNSINREFEIYLYSEEFTAEAQKSGVLLRTGVGELEEIIMEEPSDVNMDVFGEEFWEEIGEGNPLVIEDVGSPVDEILNEPEDSEDIEEVEAVEPLIEEETETPEAVYVEEIQEESPQEITSSDQYGYSFKSSGNGKKTGVEMLYIALAYGGSTNMLYRYDQSSYNYLLTLPKSLGKIVISFNSMHSKASDIKDLDALYEEFFNAKENATLYVTSSSEKLLYAYSNIFSGSLYVSKHKLSRQQLSSSIFDNDNYEANNDVFDKDLMGNQFSNNVSTIKTKWKGAKEGARDFWSYVRGLNYLDYLYIPSQYLYNKGGKFIQSMSNVYYVPKTKRAFELYELGSRLKKNDIEVKDYERATGKVSKSEFKQTVDARAIRCDGNDIETKLYFCSEEGEVFSVTAVCYNYFVKYYGLNLETKFSGNYLQIMQAGQMIGFIPATVKSTVEVKEMVMDQDEILAGLRSIDGTTFDFMRDAIEVYGIESIGLTKKEKMPSAIPILSPEEVNEDIDEIKDEQIEEADKELDDAIDELLLEVNSLKEMKEMVGDDEEAVGDIDLEIESLLDMYELLTGEKLMNDEK